MKKFIAILITLVLTMSCSYVVFAEDIANEILIGEEQAGEMVPDDGTTSTAPVPDSAPDIVVNEDGVIPDFVIPAPEKPVTAPDKDVSSKDTTDYAGNLFGDVDLSKSTPSADAINEELTGIASWVISIVIAIFPSIIVICTLVDMGCIVASPIMWFFATVVPFQLFSSEVVQITGVSFAGAAASTTAPPVVDLKGQNPLMYYMKKRIVTIVIALTVVTLFATGVWFKLVSMVANPIVSWLMGM